MTVEEPKKEQEKVLIAEATPQQPQVDVNVSQNPQQTKDEVEPHSDNPNWKAYRETLKKERSEKKEAEKRLLEKEAEAAALKAAMEAAFSKNSPSPQAYQQYYGIQTEQFEETEDQKIEKKVNAILEAKEQKIRKDREERERQELPNRIKAAYPDFYSVVSEENLDYLDFHYPEVSRPMQRLADGYEKWSDIYHAVKKFVPNHSTAKKEAAKADINQNKPKSISSGTMTHSGEPVRQNWQESEQRRAENWARMQRIMKGV